MSTDDIYREEAMRLVDDELDIFPPEKDYLEYLNIDLQSRIFCTDIITNEHNRLENKLPKIPSHNIYNLSTPIRPDQDIHGEPNLESWTNGLRQLKIKLEYKIRQTTNLSMLDSNHKTIWDNHLRHIELTKSDLEAEIKDLNKQIQNIHDKREADQTELAKSLRLIEDEWSNNGR